MLLPFLEQSHGEFMGRHRARDLVSTCMLGKDRHNESLAFLNGFETDGSI